MKVFRALSWFFKQEKWRFITAFLAMFVTAFCSLVPPQIIGRVIDHMTSKTLTSHLLMMYLGLILFTGLMVYVLRYYARLQLFGASAKLGRLLRQQLYDKYISMRAQFFQTYRTGDLMAHATNDIRAVQSTAGVGVMTISDALIMGGMTLVMMAVTVSPKLTLIAMLPLPILVILTQFYGKLLHKGFKDAQGAFSELNDKTQESIAGVKVTKSFGYERADEEDFRELSDRVVAKNLKVTKIDALFDPTIQLVIGASYLLSVVFGAYMVIGKAITIGQLITFTTYLGMMVWPLLALGFFFNIVQRGSASYERILKLLAEPDDTHDQESLSVAPTANIRFQLKEFTFPEETDPSLHDVTFTIEPGMTVGIVGVQVQGKVY